MRVIERFSTPLSSADSNQLPHVQAESATVSSKIEGDGHYVQKRLGRGFLLPFVTVLHRSREAFIRLIERREILNYKPGVCAIGEPNGSRPNAHDNRT